MTDRPLVAVLVGTDHHPFERLVSWSARIASLGEHEWFVQHGDNRLVAGLTGRPMLGIDELQDLLERADAVVTHGGPGLIMEARAAGHVPVVVPRDPGLGEHVDNHQQLFARRLARDETVVLASDCASLRDAVAHQVLRGRLTTSVQGSAHQASIRLAELVDSLVRSR